MKQLKSRTPKQHFIIGTFKNNYIYSIMEEMSNVVSKMTSREVLLSLAEDFYKDDHLDKEHIEEGIEQITTITVNEFLYESFFEREGATAGFLHISMSPKGFKVVFDPVDFPDLDFIKKFPQEKRVKTVEELWDTIKTYVDQRDSIIDKIEKLL